MNYIYIYIYSKFGRIFCEVDIFANIINYYFITILKIHNILNVHLFREKIEKKKIILINLVIFISIYIIFIG